MPGGAPGMTIRRAAKKPGRPRLRTVFRASVSTQNSIAGRVQPVRTAEDITRARPVGRADDGITLHLVEDAGGAAVAQAQIALEDRSRSFAHLADHAHGVAIQRIFFGD